MGETDTAFRSDRSVGAAGIGAAKGWKTGERTEIHDDVVSCVLLSAVRLCDSSIIHPNRSREFAIGSTVHLATEATYTTVLKPPLLFNYGVSEIYTRRRCVPVRPLNSSCSKQISMVVFGIWVINKAGGLVYQRNYGGMFPVCTTAVSDSQDNAFCCTTDGLPTLTPNEYLVMAGTLHGIHAITSRLSPTGKSSGVQVIEGEGFKLNVMLTLTGALVSFSIDRTALISRR